MGCWCVCLTASGEDGGGVIASIGFLPCANYNSKPELATRKRGMVANEMV